MPNIRELNNWIIDFDKFTAYKYIGGKNDVFEWRDYRTLETLPSTFIEYKKLPRHIRIWIRTKYPSLGISN